MTTLISRDELRAAIEAGTVTVVDALGGDYYTKRHLPGAIPLVEDDVAARRRRDCCPTGPPRS